MNDTLKHPLLPTRMNVCSFHDPKLRPKFPSFKFKLGKCQSTHLFDEHAHHLPNYFLFWLKYQTVINNTLATCVHQHGMMINDKRIYTDGDFYQVEASMLQMVVCEEELPINGNGLFETCLYNVEFLLSNCLLFCFLGRWYLISMCSIKVCNCWFCHFHCLFVPQIQILH